MVVQHLATGRGDGPAARDPTAGHGSAQQAAGGLAGGRASWACSSTACRWSCCRRRRPSWRRWPACGSARACCCRWRCTWTPRDRRASPAEAQAPPLNRFLARSGGVIFLDVREILARPAGRNERHRSRSTSPRRPSSRRPGARRWATCGRATQPRRGSAGQFNLNLATIQQIGRSATMARRRPPRRCADRVWEACLRQHAPAAGPAGPAARAQGDLGRPGAARPEARAAPAPDRRPGAPAQHGLRRLGLPREDEPRPGHQRAVRRRERHRQDHGRRGASPTSCG